MTADARSATPFLDRRLPLPRRTFFARMAVPAMVAVVVVCGVVGAFAFAASRGWLEGDRFDRLLETFFSLRGVLFMLAVFGVYVAIIVIHESGHVLGGLLGGFRFEYLRVSLFIIHRAKGISLDRNFVNLVTGEARMSPPPDAASHGPYIVMVAGGVAANLIAAAIVGAVATSLMAKVFVGLSVIVAFFELLPVETQRAVTDGGRLRMLLFDRERGARWVAILQLLAESAAGTVPQKMSARWIGAATAIRDGSADTVSAHALAYAAALSNRAFTEAGELMDVCLQFVAHGRPGIREALISDAVVYQAGVRHAPELAMAWLQDLPRKAPAWFRVRAEAATLEEGGLFMDAWTKLDALEKTLVSTDPRLPLIRNWKAGLQNRSNAQ
jgi:hypothetical protein